MLYGQLGVFRKHMVGQIDAYGVLWEHDGRDPAVTARPTTLTVDEIEALMRVGVIGVSGMNGRRCAPSNWEQVAARFACAAPARSAIAIAVLGDGVRPRFGDRASRMLA